MVEIDVRSTSAGTTAKMEAHAHLHLQVKFRHYKQIFGLCEYSFISTGDNKIVNTITISSLSLLPQALLPADVCQASQVQIVTCIPVGITARMEATVQLALETSQHAAAHLIFWATSASIVSAGIM